jgi:serine/threonine-protein kinase HipA
MSQCPITYEQCEGRYSKKGLASLSSRLRDLSDFPYSAQAQIREAAARSGKMSVQGVQPKLSAVLIPSEGSFRVVDSEGRYILKPQHPAYPELPENEDLTMRLASLAGIDVPIHGMIWCLDGSLTYFIKRFDRVGRSGKLPMEDFAQLGGGTRDTKYKSSMEKVAKIIENHCTFPAIEQRRLFLRTLFCFLSGNEDMHLKNFSLLTRNDHIQLAPAYDFLNSTIAINSEVEEVALPFRGKRSNLTKSDWIDYWGRERLGLTQVVVEKALQDLSKAMPKMLSLIASSFLSAEAKESYQKLLISRAGLLGMSY